MSGYISEFQYYGLSDEEFIEVAVPAGTNVSSYSVVIYQWDGTVVNSYGLGSIEGTMDGKDIYTIDSNTAGFDAMSGNGEMYADDAIALVDGSGNVVQFISYWGNTVTATEGPAAGMTSVDVGTASDYGTSLQSDDGGASYYKQYTPNKDVIPACYAPGSRIRTPDGEVPVEALRVGDLVETPDGGRARICWVWSGHQPLDDVALHQKPVLISKGALAAGVPDADLIVSSQHRIAVGMHKQCEQLFGTAAFVPAKALVGLPGVRHMRGKQTIEWQHFLCEEHQVVFANGAASESLLLGPQFLSGLDRSHRAQLIAVLGKRALLNRSQSPALPTLTKKQAQKLIAASRQTERNGLSVTVH